MLELSGLYFPELRIWKVGTWGKSACIEWKAGMGICCRRIFRTA